MNPVHAVVLGLTQGVTEFLPVSSSGHLLLVPRLLGWDDFAGDEGLEKAFDASLHLGTTMALLGYFARDILPLGAALLRSLRRRAVEGRDQQLAWLLVLSAAPGALTGAVLESFIEEQLGSPLLIAAALVIFGLLLGFADRRFGARGIEAFGRREAVLMGAAQAIALSPGVSRSGATITAGRLLGFDRDAAARISFLMSVPIVVGAIGFKTAKLFLVDGGIPPGFAGAFAIGAATSAASGFVAVSCLLRVLRTRTFDGFVLYRVIAGCAVAGLALGDVGRL